MMNKLLPSEKQAALLGLKNVSKKIVVLTGSIRSGKTLFGAKGFAGLIIQQQDDQVFEGNRYAFVGQANVTSTYKNVASRCIRVLELNGWNSRKVGTSHDYILTKGEKMVMVECFSVNNKRSYEKLIGGTYRSIFIDEAPLMNEEALDKIAGRCASFKDHKIVHTGNPQGSEAHWYYKKYLNGNESVLDVRFNMLDNPTMTQADVEQWKNIMSRATYEQHVLGKWVIAEGKCYDKLPPIREVAADEVTFIYFGIDYGEATDETTLVSIACLTDDTYCILSNYAHSNDGAIERKDVNAYHRDIRNEINKIMAIYSPNEGATCSVEYSPPSLYYLMVDDLSINKHVEIIKANKTSILPQNRKENGVVNERTDLVNSMILTDLLSTVSHDFPIIEEMKEARYENGKRVGKDHSLDALEYGLRPEFREIIAQMGIYELEEAE